MNPGFEKMSQVKNFETLTVSVYSVIRLMEVNGLDTSALEGESGVLSK